MGRIGAALLCALLIAAAGTPALAAARAPAAALSAGTAAAGKPPPKRTSPATGTVLPPPSDQTPAGCAFASPLNPGSPRVTSTPWAQQALDFTSVWSRTRGQGVLVAVVDSGVDSGSAPQLAGKVSSVDVSGTGLEDCVGHGTAVAAIIAASPEAGQAFVGVAPDVRILSVKVQNAVNNPASNGGSANVAAGIRAAALLGAQVISVSIQTKQSTLALLSAVDFALSRGDVIVAAGGNDESPELGAPVVTGPFYPASYPGVLSVGAINPDGSLASFSDKSSNVAVTAPGNGVTSAWYGGGYDSFAGTSFATPFVSGVAALVRSEYPNLTGPQVVQRIEETADGGTGPGTGYGLVNPLQAVTAELPPGPVPTAPPPAPPHPVAVLRQPPMDRVAHLAAMSVTLGAIAAGALTAFGAVVITQGRRRRWHATRAKVLREPDEAPAPGAEVGADAWP